MIRGRKTSKEGTELFPDGQNIISHNKLEEEDRAVPDSPGNVAKSMGMIHSESATSTV